jgi:N-methylhydantoinase B
VVTPGAGGFGPPQQRDPAAAARDLEEGAISVATARDIYGVSR